MRAAVIFTFAVLLTVGIATAQRGSAVTPLPAPGGIAIAWGDEGPTLSWLPVAGAGYLVEHATAPAGPWTMLTRGPIAVTQLTHRMPIPPGAPAYYRLSAVAPLMSPGVAIAGFLRPRPAAVLGVGVRQVGSSMLVSWVPTPGATGYSVGFPGRTLATAPANARAVMVPTTAAVEVVAHLALGAATGSDLVGPYPPLAPAPAVCWPAARLPGEGPASVSVVTDYTWASVNWPAVTDAAAYLVERAPAALQAQPEAWESLACLAPSAGTQRLDDLTFALAGGRQYAYRVTAFGSAGQAGWSVGVATTAPLTNPASLSAAASGGAVDLSWTPAPGARAYLIESSYGLSTIVPAQPAFRVWGVPPGTHTFRVTSLFPGHVPGPGAPATSPPVTVLP